MRVWLSIILLLAIFPVSVAYAGDQFYSFDPQIKQCDQHLWGYDCSQVKYKTLAKKTPEKATRTDSQQTVQKKEQPPVQQADQSMIPQQQAPQQSAPSKPTPSNNDYKNALTSQQYLQQVMWKNIPKKYLLRPDEEKELGELQPEARNIPLPLLKFILRPPSETPAQTRADYEAYVEWNKNLDNVIQQGAVTMAKYELANGDIKPSPGVENASGQTNASATLTNELYPSLSAMGGPANSVLPIPGKDIFFIYIFNSDCPFCHRMTPVVADFLKRHPKVTTIGYDSAEPVRYGKAYIRNAGLRFQVISAKMNVLRHFGVSPGVYPRLIVIDRKTGAFDVVRGFNPESAIVGAVRIISIARK